MMERFLDVYGDVYKLHRNALPQVMTEQQNFGYSINDCSSRNEQEFFTDYKKRTFFTFLQFIQRQTRILHNAYKRHSSFV